MKKTTYMLSLAVTTMVLTGCGNSNNSQQWQHPPFPPGMSANVDLSIYGIELDESPLAASEIEEENIPSSPSASNYLDFVENTNFSYQVVIKYTGTDAKVENTPSGVSVTKSGADLTITSSLAGVEYILSGNTDNGSLNINSQENVKITLDNCHIKNPDGSAVSVSGAPYTYMVLKGDNNYLEDGFIPKTTKVNENPDGDGSANYTIEDLKQQSQQMVKDAANGIKQVKNSIKGTIFVERNLVFSGNGKLSIQCFSKTGIRADEELAFRSGNVITVRSHEGKGVSGKTAVIIYGGALNIDTGQSNKRGISSKGILAIYGGRTIVLSAGGDKAEGIEAKGVMTINGGDIRIASSDDGVNAGEDLVVNGGCIYACSPNNDALDANGNLIINGGTILAIGGGGPECGLDANDEAGFNLYINGGTVLAIGARNSIPSKKSRQNSIVYGGNIKPKDIIGIASGDSILMAYNICSEYGEMGCQILFSSELINNDGSYTVVKGLEQPTNDSYFGLTIHPTGMKTEPLEQIKSLEKPVTKVGVFHEPPHPPHGGPGMPPPPPGR